MFWRSLKAGDYGLVGLLFLISMIGFWKVHSLPEGQYVVVQIDNRGEYRYAIGETGQIELNGPLGMVRIRMENGHVWIEETPCPHQLCKKMGHISKAGETLVCIPNKVFIIIEGDSPSDVDAVTQ